MFKQKERERERERLCERLFCALDSIFTVTVPLYKLQSSGTHFVAEFEFSRLMFDSDLISP